MAFRSAVNGEEIVLSVLADGDATKPRVVYVHGTPGSARNWLDYLASPLDGYESIAIDRPGFGDSGPGHALTSLRQQAQAIERLLVERDGKWPVLVGHSLGGPVITRVAADNPGKVRAIVLIASSLDPKLEKVLLIQRIGNFAFVPWLIPRWARHSNRELLVAEEELRELEPLLANITCPIVIVHGTRDRLVPYENVAYMLDKFAHNDKVDLVRLENENHFIIWTREQVIRDAIRRAEELASGR